MSRNPLSAMLAIGLALCSCVGWHPARGQEVDRARVLAALPALDQLARQAVDDGDIPGLAIAVVFHDEVVFAKGFGLREVGQPDSVDADTIFYLASCSKPIASTVVAALVGDGILGWDARIADIDPDFQLHDEYATAHVTVADLFAHRSGLPGTAGNDLEGIGYERPEILRRLRLVPPSSSFRSGYSYSNSGLTEGAVAATHAAGVTWEDAADSRLFRPLGMASTSARYGDFLAHANRAYLHTYQGDRWVAGPLRNADAESPAGGISSSARDMARWMRLQLAGGVLDGRRFVDAAALARTHQPMIYTGVGPTGADTFYALGWSVRYGARGPVWTHAGAFSQGVQTVVTLVPADQLGIVVLGNAFPTGVPDALSEIFLDTVAGQPTVPAQTIASWNRRFYSLVGPSIQKSEATYAAKPTSPTAAMPMAAYVGVYANAYLGAAHVVEGRGGLHLLLGPEQVTDLPLTHFDRDLFTAVLSPELPALRTAVAFRIGPDGKATAVTVEGLDEEGLGTLTRTLTRPGD